MQIKKEELLVMTLDAEEAFDLVSWPFMLEVLSSFGLDKKFYLDTSPVS